MLKEALLHLIYPALCTHCKALLFSHQKLLCPKCLDLLTLLDPQNRCMKCFSECQSHIRICGSCQQKKATYTKLGACFEHFGPAQSLLRAFESKLLLDTTLSSWMIVQLDRLKWPTPDLIIPFPRTLTERLQHGYNRALLLSQKMGESLNIPVENLLSRTQTLYEDTFGFKKNRIISDKTLLLVEESIFSRESIHSCTEVLQEGFPKAIYVLGFTLST